ncbi:MAG TPA: fused MFS/spermidine synthase [Bacteroidia bacterium]|jgi:predicted membrane-bound spermidine synthase|nr:fused MFS/spermidine synthase [Bacteroidia bacterium]
MQIPKNKNFYFLLSFIEGGSVMAAELLGAKMLAPYFGSSLYVWATVLAITLGGLAFGYFVGGIFSYKSKNALTLFYVLLAAAIFTILMPFTSKVVLWAIGLHALIPSVIVSSICILLPPVMMMGMVSPLIIRTITADVDQSGRAAGAIYAISTVGGILATFAFGFYIIPSFGLTLPSIITGIVLGFIPAIIVFRNKEKVKAAGFFLFCVWSIITANQKNNSAINVIYNTEGLLGQLTVIDFPHVNKEGIKDGHSRWMYVNRISQTMYDSLADESKGEEKYFTYVYRISNYLKTLPKNSRVLLLGLGGGSLVKVLSEQGFKVEVCELDKRIAYVARNYFYVNKDVKVVVDDARHFIKTCHQTYDVIIFDTFKGEDPPNHVFTLESLAETKKLLNPDAVIFVNSMGYIDGKIGKAMRSIYKTFLAAGFKVEVLPTESNPDQRNLVFHASLTGVHPNPQFIPASKIDLQDAVVLQDEYPVLDMLNAEAARRWRSMAMSSFKNGFSSTSLPLFN